MPLKYFIKDHGEGPEDARELPTVCAGKDVDNVRHFAQRAATHCHMYHEGYEWTWPVVFTIMLGDNLFYDVEVKRELDPVFYGTIIKPDGAKIMAPTELIRAINHAIELELPAL